MSHCIFCFKHKDNLTSFCPDNPGLLCTYGYRHEYPGEEFSDGKVIVKPTKKQAPAIDKKLCTQCGLHQKNPASLTSTCIHTYES